MTDKNDLHLSEKELHSFSLTLFPRTTHNVATHESKPLHDNKNITTKSLFSIQNNTAMQYYYILTLYQNYD